MSESNHMIVDPSYPDPAPRCDKCDETGDELAFCRRHKETLCPDCCIERDKACADEFPDELEAALIEEDRLRREIVRLNKKILAGFDRMHDDTMALLRAVP